jgi:secondary thiamine-phosphate synthase enzyme
VLSRDVRVDTARRRVVDVTDDAAAIAREAGGDGLLNAFVPHATAGIAIMETGSGSEPDLVETLERLLPRDDRYRHRHGSTGHGADHLLPVLVSPSVTIPVRRGRLELGVWQRLVVVDLNPDNPERTLRLSFLGDV